MSSRGLLIRGARQLLTLRGPSGPRRGLALLDLGIIPDGAVLMSEGLIQAVGTDRQVLNLARSRNCLEIDATGRVVMPAFVDPIVSLVHARPSPRNYERIFRGYGHPETELFREALAEGSHTLKGLSSQTLKRRAAQTAAAMLRHGTGFAESRAPYGMDYTMTMKVLRIQSEQRVEGIGLDIMSSCLLECPSVSEAASWTEYVCSDLLPKVRRRKIAKVIDLQHDTDTLPAPLAAQILHTARQLGFSPRIHSTPFAANGAVSFGLAHSLSSVQVDRLVSPDEIEMLANFPTAALFTPGIALQTGLDRHPPGRAMVDSGVIPALASAYHPELSPTYSMQMILLLASRLYRWTPEEAISAATINNAHAVGAEFAVGSLETGKQADALILDVSDYRELAYHAGINVVDKVIKRGALVYDSRLTATSQGNHAGN